MGCVFIHFKSEFGPFLSHHAKLGTHKLVLSHRTVDVQALEFCSLPKCSNVANTSCALWGLVYEGSHLMDCTADPPKTRLNSSGSGQLNRGCSQVICLQREKHARWNPLFSNFLFISRREMNASWSLPFIYDSYSQSFNHHCGFPLGWFQSLLILLWLRAHNWAFALPHAWESLLQILPIVAHSHPSGFSLNHTPLRDCLWNIPQPLQTSQAAERGRHAHWIAPAESLRSPTVGHDWVSTHTHTHTHTHTAGSRFHACTLAAKKSRSGIHNVGYSQTEEGCPELLRSYVHEDCPLQIVMLLLF